MHSKKTTRVRFAATSEMAFVMDLAQSPYSQQLWFTEDELDGFKDNSILSKTIVRHIVAMGGLPSANAVVGMEKFLTRELTNEYMLRREEFIQAVLNEAKWQSKAMRQGDPQYMDRLSAIACENSKWAKERARAAALFLQQDVEKQHQEVNSG